MLHFHVSHTSPQDTRRLSLSVHNIISHVLRVFQCLLPGFTLSPGSLSDAYFEVPRYDSFIPGLGLGLESLRQTVANGVVMHILLLITFVILVDAQQEGPMPKQKLDCSLEVGFLWYDSEPKGNPLRIHVLIQILHIRDIPDSGGSFGVDIKYDKCQFKEILDLKI